MSRSKRSRWVFPVGSFLRLQVQEFAFFALELLLCHQAHIKQLLVSLELYDRTVVNCGTFWRGGLGFGSVAALRLTLCLGTRFDRLRALLVLRLCLGTRFDRLRALLVLRLWALRFSA